MLERTSMRWLVAILVLGYAGACRCPGKDPNNCGTVEVAFETPTADMKKTPSVLDVRIAATKDGTTVDLAAAKLQTRASADPDFGTARNGTIAGSKATFTGVTLAEGDNQLKADVEIPSSVAGSTCKASKTITVTVDKTVDTSAPDVTAFAYDGDANNDNVLNDAEVMAAGGNIAALVSVAHASGCKVKVVDQANPATIIGPAVAVAASAPTKVILSGLNNPMTGTFQLRAAVTECEDATRTNADTDSEAKSTLRVDRIAPTCNLLDPSVDVVGPMDDADRSTIGYQLRGSGTADGEKTMELSLTGGPTPLTTGLQSPLNHSLLNDFTIPTTGATSYTLKLTAIDDAGNVCTSSRTVSADFQAPVVTLTSPTQAGSPYAMYNIAIAATVADVGNNVEGQNMECSSSAGNIGGPFVVTNGMATGTASFLAGMQTVTCTVIDRAGNLSAPATQMINVTGGTGCALVFVAPSKSPTTLTRSSGPVTNNILSYTFQLQTNAACAGKTVTLSRIFDGNRVQIGTPGPTNGSGLYTQTVSLQDSAGQIFVYEGAINDGVNNITRVTQQFVVSLEAPAITGPPAGTINVSQDIALNMAGVQRTLSYQPTTPTGSTTTVCSDVNVFDAGTPCPDGVGFTYATNVTNPSNSFTFVDGTYSLKPVFVSSSGSTSGAFVAYTVDSIRPKVATVSFPADTNSDGILNATEQATGAPVVSIQFANAPAHVENGRTVTVINRSNGSPVGTGTVNTNAAMVTLSGLTLTSTTENNFDLEVRVTDAANNANNPTGATPADAIDMVAFKTLSIDRAPPTCIFTLPNRAQLGIADDADGVTSGYQLRSSVTTSLDVSGNMGVTIALTGAATQSANGAPSGGSYTTDFTVSSTGELDYTLTATCKDAAGNTTTSSPVAVKVDNVAPSGCMLTAPSGSAIFSNPAITTTVVASNANGLIPVITSTAGGGGNLPAISGGTSGGVIVYMDGMGQTVTAKITDAAGNSCTSSQVINVQSSGCSVSFITPATTPAVLNKSNDATPASATTLEYTLTGQAPNCVNTTVRLFKGTPGSQVAMTTTNGSGAFSFNISEPEGQVHYEARMDNGVQATYDLVELTIDLSDPQVSAVLPAGNPLFFVAPGNEFVRLGTAGYVVDLNPGVANAQASVSATIAGAAGGSASVLYCNPTCNSVGGPTTVSQDPQTVNFMVALPHNSTGNLVIRAVDAAGNQVDVSRPTTVDVLAPNDPVLTASLVIGKERTAEVALAWTAVGDDGASGTVAGYDVRWTTSTVLSGGLTSVDDFMDSSKAYAEANGTTSTSIASVKVPPMNSYYFYVRAKDEVGNYSAFVPAAAPASQIDNFLTKQTFANPKLDGGSSDHFGVVMAAGKIDGDPYMDLVVGNDVPLSGTHPNAVYIYWGSDGGLAATPQTLPPYDGVLSPSPRWGTQIAMGHASSTTTEDLLVGGYGHPGVDGGSNGGVAVLYFAGTGSNSLDTSASNYILFSSPGGGGGFGRGLSIVPDINGDGLDELLIASPNDNPFGGAGAGSGAVYLWYGRSQAAWKALTQPVLSTSADRIFTGPTPTTTQRFGRQGGGFANVGRASGSGPKDFAIPQSHTSYNSLYMYKGADVNAAAAGTSFATTGSHMLQTLAAPTALASPLGFSSRAIGDIDIAGGSATDLVVSYPISNSVQIYADRTGTGFPAYGSTAFNIREPGAFQFGNDFQAVDWNGDGKRDLFIGTYSDASPLTTTGLYIYPNRAIAGSEFDTSVGTRFFSSKIAPLPAGSSMGGGVALGDFNNDGKLDLATSDHLDGIGKVFVWQ